MEFTLEIPCLSDITLTVKKVEDYHSVLHSIQSVLVVKAMTGVTRFIIY